MVFTYGNKTIVLRERERSRIRVVQMDNLRGLLGMRRLDKGILRSDEGCGRKD